MPETYQGRILLIGSDDAFRTKIAPHIKQEGYQLKTVAHTHDPTALLLEFEPDLVLIAHEQSQMGIRAGQQVLELAGFRPIILLVQDADIGLARTAIDAGLCDVFDQTQPLQHLMVRVLALLRIKGRSDLAATQLAELNLLANATRKLGCSQQIEDVVRAIAQIVQQFDPVRLITLDMNEDAPALHVLSATPIDLNGELMRTLLGYAQLSTFDVKDRVVTTNWPQSWPVESNVPAVYYTPTSDIDLQIYVVLQPSRPLSTDELRVFRQLAERICSPLHCAQLYADRQQDKVTLPGLVLSAQFKSISNLADGVAHQIKNPLAFVISNLNVLREYVDDVQLLLHLFLSGRIEEGLAEAARIDVTALLEDMLPLIRESIEGSERVHDIVQELDSFTELESREAFTEVNMQAVIESVLNFHHRELSNILHIRRELHPAPPVRGDRGKLQHVLLNLIRHIVQSIPEGHQGHLTVRLFPSGSEVAIELETDGSTIAVNSEQPTFPHPSHDVLGLNLRMVDKIVKYHGGRIEIRTPEDTGNIYTIWLPARITSPIPQMVVEAPEMPCGVAVFIDDEKYLLNAYTRAFGRSVKVYVAQGGAEGIRLLQQLESVDVVLCDLVMPKVSGIDVYQWVQTHRKDLLERFVVITGGHHGERNHEFLERTKLPVIHKPFRIKNVAQLLNRYIKQ